ncbi:MAG: hypothetical protein V3U54_12975 [Thermodesulfobacteriota bacterium]
MIGDNMESSNPEESSEIESVVVSPKERPRMPIGKLRAKYDKEKTIYIEFEDTQEVIEIVMRRGLPWQKTSRAEKAATTYHTDKKTNTRTTIIDPIKIIKFIWKDLIIKSDPPISVADLDVMEGSIANDIIMRVYTEYQDDKEKQRVQKN